MSTSCGMLGPPPPSAPSASRQFNQGSVGQLCAPVSLFSATLIPFAPGRPPLCSTTLYAVQKRDPIPPVGHTGKVVLFYVQSMPCDSYYAFHIPLSHIQPIIYNTDTPPCLPTFLYSTYNASFTIHTFLHAFPHSSIPHTTDHLQYRHSMLVHIPLSRIQPNIYNTHIQCEDARPCLGMLYNADMFTVVCRVFL